MKHQDKFDEIINKKMNSQEFPFDEANWEKAAAMIDASRKGKNRAGLWIFSTLIVLTCGVIGFYTLSSVASTDADKLSQSTEVAKQNAEVMASSIVIPEPTSEQNTEAIAPTSIENNSNENTAVSETAGSEVKAAALHITASSKNKVTVSAEKVSHNNSASDKTSTEPAIAAKVIPTEHVRTQKPAKIDMNKKAQPQADPNTNNTVNKVSTPAEPKVAETKTKEVAGEKNPKTLPVLGTNITPTETNNAAKPSEPEVKVETAVTAVDSSNKEITKAKIDTASTVAEISKPVEPKLYKNLVSLEAGADYKLGYQNPGSTDANGFNPILGINYTRFFAKKIGLSIGIQYNSVSNLNYSSVTSKDTRYTFGAENDVTVITPTKLHYIVAPIKLNFAINPNNIIGLGYNVAYLMTVDNKVDTYNERMNYVSAHSVSKTKGYSTGIKEFDTQLSLFYRKTIYKDLSLNAEVFYGLNDVKDNTFFNSNVYERNVGFKLTLLLNVFKK